MSFMASTFWFFTNKASSSGLNARLGQDLGGRGRLSFYFRTNRTGFLVPNDPVQQDAGQRQDLRTQETAGQIHYQHTFSSRALGSLRVPLDEVQRLGRPRGPAHDPALRPPAEADHPQPCRTHFDLSAGTDARPIPVPFPA
ncbi:MAG: hypothetical protein HC869_15070, partial [Rhodospirillales bacterium]|nr:hypothetical protein [Rhodospirillales bacterium]